MLISGIGSVSFLKKHNVGNTYKQASKQSGFTLVEVMVALFIMGLMAGAVIINMPEREDVFTTQANKMASHLELASQMSLIKQSSLGVTFEDDGYNLVKYDDEEWAVLKSFTFSDDYIPTLSLSQNGSTLDFEEVKKSEIPLIRYDPTGLATPFVLSIGFGGEKIKMTGHVDGSLTFEESGG